MSFRNVSVRPGLVALGIALLLGFYIASSYNSLIRLDQQVQSQWAQVENTYQRRLDLIPNLVETVRGAAAFEKSAFTAVAEARAQVGRTPANSLQNPAKDPSQFEKLQKTQDGLTTALSRLMVVVERYPDLKATENFRDLQAQLEGSENRISVERMRFNEVAQAFNAKRESFPTNLLANMSGARFQEKSYFKAQATAETAPKVKF